MLTHSLLLTFQQYITDIVTPVTFKLFSLDNSSLTHLILLTFQQYRTDIVTPVTFIVRYAITQQAGTGQDCNTTPCPVINVFNANRQVPDADFFEQMVCLFLFV